MNRRGFFKAAVGVLGALVAAILGAPLVASVLGGLYRVAQGRFVTVARVGDLPVGRPVSVGFQDLSEDAYVRRMVPRDVWVVRHGDTDVTVFSPICTHLGCHCDWDAASQRFVCPCHGSVFSITGQVLGGPAPRPLDTLPAKIEGGELQVMWQRFEPGAARKVRIA